MYPNLYTGALHLRFRFLSYFYKYYGALHLIKPQGGELFVEIDSKHKYRRCR